MLKSEKNNADLNKKVDSELENGSPILSKEVLELRLKKLSYLALHLDPYAHETNDQTLLNLVEEFNLKSELNNPFHFTNKLLSLIDNTENTLKSLMQ